MRGALVAILLLVALASWAGMRACAPALHGIDRRAFEAAAPEEPALRLLPGAARARPNLIVILADDLGWGDLSVQGSRAIGTPHIDRLAAEGMRLTQFYASAPVCSPSRAGLLTGRYPVRTGIVTPMQSAGDTSLRRLTYRAAPFLSKLGAADMVGAHNAVRGLPTSELTLAEALRQAGYRTMAVGKWHLGDFRAWPEYHPSKHGFDRFAGFQASNDDWPVSFWRDDEEIVRDVGLDQAAYTRIFTEEAVRFVEQSGDAPFFLYLAHKDPHQPFFPSETFAGRSAGGPYGDAVSELDWSVGEVLAALRRRGIVENTLVVFTSDNGPWFEGSPGGLRGRKGQSYEGGFRVPFLAHWPGRIPAGATSDVPAMNIDLFPTFLARAGLAAPDDRAIDGADLWPVLSGARRDLGERALYFFHDYDVEAVRAADWKYLDRISHYTWPTPLDKRDTPAGRLGAGRDYTPPGSHESVPTLGTWPLLYDLSRDPEEAYNVAHTHPDVARRLAARLEAWRSALRANPRGWR